VCSQTTHNIYIKWNKFIVEGRIHFSTLLSRNASRPASGRSIDATRYTLLGCQAPRLGLGLTRCGNGTLAGSSLHLPFGDGLIWLLLHTTEGENTNDSELRIITTILMYMVRSRGGNGRRVVRWNMSQIALQIYFPQIIDSESARDIVRTSPIMPRHPRVQDIAIYRRTSMKLSMRWKRTTYCDNDGLLVFCNEARESINERVRHDFSYWCDLLNSVSGCRSSWKVRANLFRL